MRYLTIALLLATCSSSAALALDNCNHPMDLASYWCILN